MHKKLFILILLFSIFSPIVYGWNLTDSSFTLDSDIFSPWSTELKWKAPDITTGNDMADNINYILINIIDLLIISFWVLSLLVMSIGAWYMIIYHWEEEFLSKWKTIFKAWIISLSVALLSWLIVNFVNYLIYN